MRKLLFPILLLVAALGVAAQKDGKVPDKPKDVPATVEAKVVAALELARKSLAAHGGDAFKNMKTLVVRGSADVSGSPTQTIAATFATVYSGDKYRFEVNNPMQPFSQVYDGEQTVSSVPNFQLPPINRLGLPLLQRLDVKDYVVSALPDGIKRSGFRITSPEGYFTDFFVDDKTFEVKGYQASYLIGDRSVSTAVEIDKFREVNGVKVPEKYAQRFELGFITIYTDFKAKEIIVNSEIADDVFVLK